MCEAVSAWRARLGGLLFPGQPAEPPPCRAHPSRKPRGGLAVIPSVWTGAAWAWRASLVWAERERNWRSHHLWKPRSVQWRCTLRRWQTHAWQQMFGFGQKTFGWSRADISAKWCPRSWISPAKTAEIHSDFCSFSGLLNLRFALTTSSKPFWLGRPRLDADRLRPIRTNVNRDFRTSTPFSSQAQQHSWGTGPAGSLRAG